MFCSYFSSARAGARQLLVSDQKLGVLVDGIVEYLCDYQLPSSLGP